MFEAISRLALFQPSHAAAFVPAAPCFCRPTAGRLARKAVNRQLELTCGGQRILYNCLTFKELGEFCPREKVAGSLLRPWNPYIQG